MATLNELSNERPAWAPRGNASFEIVNNDFSDDNYVRKAVYDASKGTKGRFNVWPFDGRKLGSPLGLVGNSSALPVIVKAMKMRHPQAEAHFLNGQSNNLVMIYLDGQMLTKPAAIQHYSFNENPANDWTLMATLPKRVKEIRRKMNVPQNIQSMKAWINVETGDVVTFEKNERFEKPLVQDPAKFGAEAAKSVLQARIAAERNGWVAFGINAEDQENVVAVVQAMNYRQARKATRAMWQVRKGDWNTLKVVTNDGTKTFTGPAIEPFAVKS